MRFREKGVSAPLAVTAVLAMVAVPVALGSNAQAAPGCKGRGGREWRFGFY